MKRIALILGFFTLYSCSNSSGHQPGLEDTIQEISPEAMDLADEEIQSQTRKTFENDEFNFHCTFIPSFHFLKRSELTGQELLEAQQEYATNSSFLLELGVKHYHDEMLKYKIQSADDYYQRIEYYSFKAASDILLMTEDDTINCGHYHFERSYGLAPKIRLNLQFPFPEEKLTAKKQVVIQVYDRIYQQGLVNFKIDTDLLRTYRLVKADSHD